MVKLTEHETPAKRAGAGAAPLVWTNRWTNPHHVDLSRPYVYYIKIVSDTGKEYRYVGKGLKPSRMKQYARGVNRALAGKTKRPAIKRDGTPQSESNKKYRYVHLALVIAVQEKWCTEHYPLENCDKAEHDECERKWIQELACNLNDGEGWHIEDIEQRKKAFLAALD